MKILVIAMAMVGMCWAAPDEGPEVFAGPEDAMLRKLMGEMLKEAEEERKEMEKPVELPDLDAPELRRLPGDPKPGRRWMIGVRMQPGAGGRILVQQVLEGTAASEAGLLSGDVLRSVNGIRLRDDAMLMDLLQVVKDQEVMLGVERGGQELEVKVTPREQDVAALLKPKVERSDDAVLEELRGMRQLMEEMLTELKKQTSAVKRAPLPPLPQRRRVVPPPQN